MAPPHSFQEAEMKRPPTTVTINVLSGLHQGASQGVSAGMVRIGGGEGADLVLADDGMATVHAELEIARGHVLLRALQAGVTLGDARPMAAGEAVRTALPARFCVAGVHMSCEGPPPRRAAWRRPATTTAVFLAVAGLVFTQSVQVPAMIGIQAPAAQATPEPPPRQAEAIPRGPHPAPTAATAASMLQGQLATAGLPGIQVAPQGSLVVASGTIPPADAARWQAVRETFDRATGGRLPLRNAVQARADRPVTLSLDSVWTGNFPNIVIGGAKYLEGSVLPNGWTLERIDTGKLHLRRGDQQVTVVF
jgi:hypothetical protein